MGKEEKAMSRYEYRVIVAKTAKEFEDWLNTLGEEGFYDRRVYYYPKTRDKDREYVAVLRREIRYD